MPPEAASYTTPSPDNRTRSNTLKKTALIAGALSTLIFGYVYIFGAPHPLKDKDSVLVSAGAFRVSPLYTVTKDATTPVVVTVEGTDKKALDMIRLKDGSTLYALIETTEMLSSNIYRRDASGAVTQLTNTQTAKFNLSLDPTGKDLVYEEKTITDSQDLHRAPWSIMHLTVDTRVVQRITSGIQPRYIHTGAVLIRQEDGVKVYPPQESNSGTLILSPKIYSVYDVSQDGTHLAAYNTKTATIDLFEITKTGTLSYVRSFKTSGLPTNLSFNGKDPVSVESIASPKGTVYSITTYAGGVRTIISPQGPIAQRLIYVPK